MRRKFWKHAYVAYLIADAGGAAIAAAKLLGCEGRLPSSDACVATHSPTAQANTNPAISPTEVSCRNLASFNDIVVRLISKTRVTSYARHSTCRSRSPPFRVNNRVIGTTLPDRRKPN